MNLPEKYTEAMKELLGSEYDSYLESFQENRLFGLRVNNLKISTEDFLKIFPFALTPIPWIENGFFYKEEEKPAKHPYYYAGLYYLQEPSAMTPADRLPVEPGDRVLDVCAAPGGKATELGARLAGKGVLVANDISNSRAKGLLKNLEVFGIDNVFVLSEEPGKLTGYFPEYFDKILIDAPCSGEGMFRKDPSMVKAWEQNGPAFYSQLQRDILEQALPMLKEGGMLLYSTCTFSPLEDEESVEYLLSLDEDLRLVEMEGYSGFAKGKPELTQSRNPELEKCVRIFPHKLEGEGHFLALLQKGDRYEEPGERRMSYKEKRSGLKGEEKELFETFSKNLNRSFENERIESKNGMLYYMPEGLPKLRGLRFLRSGLFLGEIKKKRFEPSQSLAMALRAEEYRKRVELSGKDERVVRYLKGETLTLEKGDITPESEAGGWVLVCVDGYPLGWGKLSGFVLKNKYHPGWRLV